MTPILSTAFQRHYPGPFGRFAGQDGVDATFEITCLSTEAFLIATHYWERRDEAKATADYVAAALNDALDSVFDEAASGTQRHYLTALGEERLLAFRTTYPGPFSVDLERCEQQGLLYCVRCRATEQVVIHTTSRITNRQARLVSQQVAAALNAVRNR